MWEFFFDVDSVVTKSGIISSDRDQTLSKPSHCPPTLCTSIVAVKMVFRKISSDMKDCALRLWELGWSREDICSTLCVSQASLYRWAALFEEFGSATAPPPLIRGRPRIIGMVAMNTIREIYARNSTVYLDELQWHLAIFHDIAISTSALQETLERAGLTRKVLRKIATERDEVRRAEFLHNIQHGFSGTGDEFVVVDESSKNEHTLTRRYGRAPIGQDAILTAPFVRGDRYSLVAAMSKTGYLASRVVPGSLDSYEFFDFIVEEVVSAFRRRMASLIFVILV
jgi:transposase